MLNNLNEDKSPTIIHSHKHMRIGGEYIQSSQRNEVKPTAWFVKILTSSILSKGGKSSLWIGSSSLMKKVSVFKCLVVHLFVFGRVWLCNNFNNFLMVDHHAKNAENHYYPCRIVCTSSKETHPRSVGLFLDVRQPSTLKGLDTEKWEKRRKWFRPSYETCLNKSHKLVQLFCEFSSWRGLWLLKSHIYWFRSVIIIANCDSLSS